MKKKRILIDGKKIMLGVFVIAILGISAFNYFEDAPKSTKPNFIFILTDDQGWTSTSQLMDDRVPNSKSDYYHCTERQKQCSSNLLLKLKF